MPTEAQHGTLILSLSSTVHTSTTLASNIQDRSTRQQSRTMFRPKTYIPTTSTVLARTLSEVFFLKYCFRKKRGRLIFGALKVNTKMMIISSNPQNYMTFNFVKHFFLIFSLEKWGVPLYSGALNWSWDSAVGIASG
jgi:hypothetical protein